MGRQDSHDGGHLPDGVDAADQSAAVEVPPAAPDLPSAALETPLVARETPSAVVEQPAPAVDGPPATAPPAAEVPATVAPRSPALAPDGAPRPVSPAPFDGPPPQVGTGRSSWWGPRPWSVGLAAVVLILVLVGAGLVTLRSVGVLGAAPTPTPPASPASPPPSPVLAAVTGDGPGPDPAAVASALAGPVADPSLGHLAVQVVDVATGTVLYGHGATDAMIPASTMKLATSTALLALRGPAYQIETRAVAGPAPGDVVLVGGGDPTLAIDGRGSYSGAARLDDLADQVKQALGGAEPTRVIVDSSLFSGPDTGPGWMPEDYDQGGQVSRITALMHDGGRIDPSAVSGSSPRYRQPDVVTGRVFAKLLGVTAPVTTGTAPAGARQLGVVKSPPLVSIIEQMLSASDNTVAEAMARQVAIAAGQPASFAGAAGAVRQELATLGLPLDGVTFVDGSGLSHDNRLTPRLLTAILSLAARDDHPKLHSLFTGLPVAGYSGTLARRFSGSAGEPADGAIRAKTGTLTGVDALAGYVTDADGRLLAFAALANEVPDGTYAAEQALDAIGAALASLS